ncbi:voltage-gated hydrogen channel 1 [Amblyraja radiata]|uniref:voltage-gated hydrogen channel 1 n=1 Tax=Amblyraja radiata TaxID=386614 RepID=UPI00140341D9|nr:voltage-gated hydrogen channel 1 [Amblyraja radiata]XP_032899182.1 voltage-gated hydrogen channel 1 [Amblyraja radiata]XP_032899183.1 voltage-gated hydrogen channel 1 [Amblyraja radiata]XP_032899184.1 voltage-gated hydrogen channel 1 [Amblyraja radiata]XP_032899185.1 voltage-gated hydrogen channel 1 [Amblyraja radiata]
MARFLRYFTAVGDDYQKWQEEEDTEEEICPQFSSFRDTLKWIFNSNKFQIAVVCLVILDALFVFCELLMDLSIVEADKERIVPQVFHYLSIIILTSFILELAGKLYAFRLEFFWHKFEVLDAVIVIVSFILDIVYISREDAFDGVGLLILLRLWRVARIINGILMTVKSRQLKKETELKQVNSDLWHRVGELQGECTVLTQEVERLRKLLQEHRINYQID